MRDYFTLFYPQTQPDFTGNASLVCLLSLIGQVLFWHLVLPWSIVMITSGFQLTDLQFFFFDFLLLLLFKHEVSPKCSGVGVDLQCSTVQIFTKI